MSTPLFVVKVNLSEKQRVRLIYAYNNGKTIVLRISKNSLNGNDVLHVLEGTKLKLDCERKRGINGLDIHIFPLHDIEIKDNDDVYLTY